MRRTRAPTTCRPDAEDQGAGCAGLSVEDVYENDSANLWAFAIVFAYQPNEDSDGDPNKEGKMYGAIVESRAIWELARPEPFAAIFLETIREGKLRAMPGRWTEVLRLHYRDICLFSTAQSRTKFGHAPGNQSGDSDHAEGGLMSEDGTYLNHAFAPHSIRRFRRATSWRN